MTITIDYIIGMPPSFGIDESIKGRTNTVMQNSMPIANIQPGVPSFTKGMTLFSRVPAFTSSKNYYSRSEKINGKKDFSYKSLLRRYGYELNQPNANSYLTVAYQADSFPTDSFTNEYGENFLQKFTDVASEGAASISQMMGARNVGEAINKIGSGLGGPIGEFVNKGANTVQTIGNTMDKIIPGFSTGAGISSSLMAGSRIDFPMVWKTSGFQPSYTMTIRLYNPNPGNDHDTEKYIIAPIAAIMLLGIPISLDGVTYSWPFIHKITSPGIYDLDPAFISNITVIKGGDQQQIGYTQNLGIVDIRIDFGSLFSSMLAAGKNPGRPTLKTYLDAMKTKKTGVENFSTVGNSETEIDNNKKIQQDQSKDQSTIQTKNQAPTVVEPTAEEVQTPPDRINEAVRDLQEQLIEEGENIYNSALSSIRSIFS